MNETTTILPTSGAFDRQSGSFVERLFFNNRVVAIVICALITTALGYQLTKLRFNADFEKMIPTGHPYISNYIKHKGDLKGLGHSIRIAVEAKQGSIFESDYLETLKKINDEVFFIRGVDRAFLKSIWTPNMRWLAVTEEGLEGGQVMPDNYDGSPKSLNQVRANVEHSGEIGQLVAANFKSSILFVPLLDNDPRTGEPLDYKHLSDNLEKVRQKYESDRIAIHITGFAKIVGDLIDGLGEVLAFFAITILIAAVAVYRFTRCVRSTLLVMLTSLIAVVWQLGLLPTLGFQLDPYSILVPFLVFAIGMSHGTQKMNGITQDVGRGIDKLVAARFTFRRLFMVGLTALLCDAVGFAVLLVINIGVIHELAVAACVGVAALIFTNLLLLPILLSFTGVSAAAATRSLRSEAADRAGLEKHALWRFFDRFTGPKWGTIVIIIAITLGAVGFIVSLNLQVGDLDPGAPELRPDSRYNRDNLFMVQNYATSSDVFVVMIETPDSMCTKYETLVNVDALEWELRQLPGVEGTDSFALRSRRITAGMNEDNYKWYELLANQATLNAVANRTPREMINQGCSLLSLFVFLKDHKAATLLRVDEKVQAFIAENANTEVRFLLAAGNAGIETATNAVVKQASREMLLWVYGAVIVLCFLAFRSWRAVVCAVLPLVLTSILAEALMVILGIGVKVATLPVIALGVGIGVDYALYVVGVLQKNLREGMSLSDAYYKTLLFTGRVVILTGLTLSVGVATWSFSPIKFQADMGILLAFMFLWNMLGALILLPALARILLTPASQIDRMARPDPTTVS